MTESSKTVAFENLVSVVDRLRREGKTVVQCHGVFDLLHIGHIRYLQAAKRLGDTLVVTVTPDQFVNKGPHRPVFDDRLRVQALASLDCVDYVAVNHWPTAVEALRRLKPSVYVKGAEFRDRKTPEMLQEEAEAATLGTQVTFIEDDVTSSSSYLINHFFSPFSDEVDAYLAGARRKWRGAEIADSFERCRDLKVVVIGEAIIDEYNFCSTLGQSPKSPNVVGRFQSRERFAGGALAVANHVAGFCSSVDLITLVGNDQAVHEEIASKLRPGVRPHFLVREKSGTITKRQFRETYFTTILFELDHLDDSPLPSDLHQELVARVAKLVPDADLVIVADQGHGMLDDTSIAAIVERAKFLAVSTPASAANLGFHTISRYPRADFVALAEQDLRLDRRSREGDVDRMLTELGVRLGARRALLTVGSKGCVAYGPSEGLLSAPALATRVVDRAGAGPATLAVTSLAACSAMPLDQLAFVSNVAGAQAVSSMGHSRFLDESTLRRAIDSLLK